jgi:hypothetical protein
MGKTFLHNPLLWGLNQSEPRIFYQSLYFGKMLSSKLSPSI